MRTKHKYIPTWIWVLVYPIVLIVAFAMMFWVLALAVFENARGLFDDVDFLDGMHSDEAHFEWRKQQHEMSEY